LIALSEARPLSFLITIGFGALRFWKIFNKYLQNVGSNRVTLGVIANQRVHFHYNPYLLSKLELQGSGKSSMVTNRMLVQSMQLQELLLTKDSYQVCRSDMVNDP
jgi:hypothetical protein